MYSGIDYIGVIVAAIMILGPLVAGQSHVSHNSNAAPVTQSQPQ